jgi:hypothetical protein
MISCHGNIVSCIRQYDQNISAFALAPTPRNVTDLVTLLMMCWKALQKMKE